MTKKTESKKPGALPSGKVRYRLYIGMDDTGKKLYKSFTASSMSKAKKLASEWESTHKIMNTENPTFSEAATMYISMRANVLSPRTVAEYRRQLRYLEEHFPMFCRMHMSAISTKDVQEIISSLTMKQKENLAVQKAGHELSGSVSPKTVINYHGFISSVLKSQGLTIGAVRLPQRRNVPLNIPENEIVTALLEDIKDTELEIPVLLAAFGPMRRGEICALRMSDINFETGTVHVCRSMVLDNDKQWVEKAPKSTAGERFITYPKYVTDKIQERGYVSKSTPDTITKRFTRTLSRHGFEHFRFHDLRHFAASFQIALGIPPEYIMERGGWQTAGTMRRYIHALDGQRKQMSDKANDAFSKLL